MLNFSKFEKMNDNLLENNLAIADHLSNIGNECHRITSEFEHISEKPYEDKKIR